MDSKNQNRTRIEIEPDHSVNIEGFFRIHPVPDKNSEDLYDIACLELLDYLKKIEEGARPDNAQTRLLQEDYVKQLHQIAKKICERNDSGFNLLVKLGKAKGTYLTQRNEHLKAQILGAELLPEGAPRELRLTKLDGDASEGERKLFLEIQRTYSVVDIVLSRREEKNKRRFSMRKLEIAKHAEALRIEYLRRLKDIADEAKIHRSTANYALQKLSLFQESFVSREADTVKNEHIRLLGLRAITISISMLVLFIIGYTVDNPYPELINVNKLQSFLMLSIGACAGTWLSFSLRRTIIGFGDLILLEPDRVHPTSRIIFVIILTVIVGLLLELEWIGIWISGAEVLPSKGVMQALLIGALCGVAERSLAGVVSGKADEFLGIVENKEVNREDR